MGGGSKYFHCRQNIHLCISLFLFLGEKSYKVIKVKGQDIPFGYVTKLESSEWESGEREHI